VDDNFKIRKISIRPAPPSEAALAEQTGNNALADDLLKITEVNGVSQD
jgi:hypothetical protein